MAMGYKVTPHLTAANFAVYSLTSVHNLLTFENFDSSHKIAFAF